MRYNVEDFAADPRLIISFVFPWIAYTGVFKLRIVIHGNNFYEDLVTVFLGITFHGNYNLHSMRASSFRSRESTKKKIYNLPKNISRAREANIPINRFTKIQTVRCQEDCAL